MYTFRLIYSLYNEHWSLYNSGGQRIFRNAFPSREMSIVRTTTLDTIRRAGVDYRVEVQITDADLGHGATLPAHVRTLF